MSIQDDKLIVRKLHSLESILAEPPKVTISYHAWKEFRKSIGEDLEK